MTETRRNSESTRIAYDIVAESYAELLRDELTGKPLDRALLGMFAELVLSAGGRAVADLGCGPGRIADHLHSLGVDVFGIDLITGDDRRGAQELPARAVHRRFDGVGSAVANGVLGGIVAWYSTFTSPAEASGHVRHSTVCWGRGAAASHSRSETGSICRIERGYGHQISLDRFPAAGRDRRHAARRRIHRRREAGSGTDATRRIPNRRISLPTRSECELRTVP